MCCEIFSALVDSQGETVVSDLHSHVVDNVSGIDLAAHIDVNIPLKKEQELVMWYKTGSPQ